MVDEHMLYPIIDDIVFGKYRNIDIILPYYNMKKKVGPKLMKLLKESGVPILDTQISEWTVLSEKGPKRINWLQKVHAIGYGCTVIIPDDR